MELIGTDPNLGTQPKFPTVIEPCTGIDHHRGTVDRLCKQFHRILVFRNDRFRMS